MNKNIFIRKETAQSCLQGGLPVLANVLGYNKENGNVVYEVDYQERDRSSAIRWHYADVGEPTTVYVKPLEEFLSRFMPEYLAEFVA